jgi:hypothetical protein
MTAYFNGDGYRDVAIGNPHSSVVSVLFGGAGGTLGAPVNQGVTFYQMVTADVDQNGTADLVTATLGTTNGIGVLLGAGNGTFLPAVSSAAGVRCVFRSTRAPIPPAPGHPFRSTRPRSERSDGILFLRPWCRTSRSEGTLG